MKRQWERATPALVWLGEEEGIERQPAPVVASFATCLDCGVRHDRRLSCSVATDAPPQRVSPLAFHAAAKARMKLGKENCDALIRGQRPQIVCGAARAVSPGDVIPVTPHVSVCVTSVNRQQEGVQISYTVRDFRGV